MKASSGHLIKEIASPKKLLFRKGCCQIAILDASDMGLGAIHLRDINAPMKL